MKWERFQRQEGLADSSSSGPGKRWGHTCSAVKGGRFVYVFGGYGGDDRLTNQVHVFDVERQIWTEPVIKGVPPSPRDGHSCTTVGDHLFVFGGTDGKHYLNDLHVLDTSSHTWKYIEVRGEEPYAREAHSATRAGKYILIFGGYGKVPDLDDQVFFNDLYILYIESITWQRASTTGVRPSARHGHTLSAWNKKFFVVGGEDLDGNYLSDVHILDTVTFAWKQMKTSGQVLTPRAGHVTFTLKGGSLLVFGGFAGSQTLYNDLYVLDLQTCVWSKIAIGEEVPSARFSAAIVCLDPYMAACFFLFGGCNCNKDLEPLDDIYYLHKDYVYQARVAKTLERQQNKLAMDQGKMVLEARVTDSSPLGYTIETMINGKVLRGVLLSDSSVQTDGPSSSSREKRPAASDADADCDNRAKTQRTLSKDSGVLNTLQDTVNAEPSLPVTHDQASVEPLGDEMSTDVGDDAKAGPGGDSSPQKQDEGRVVAEDANAEL